MSQVSVCAYEKIEANPVYTAVPLHFVNSTYNNYSAHEIHIIMDVTKTY